jgi:hypothetical protein
VLPSRVAGLRCARVRARAASQTADVARSGPAFAAPGPGGRKPLTGAARVPHAFFTNSDLSPIAPIPASRGQLRSAALHAGRCPSVRSSVSSPGSPHPADRHARRGTAQGQADPADVEEPCTQREKAPGDRRDPWRVVPVLESRAEEHHPGGDPEDATAGAVDELREGRLVEGFMSAHGPICRRVRGRACPIRGCASVGAWSSTPARRRRGQRAARGSLAVRLRRHGWQGAARRLYADRLAAALVDSVRIRPGGTIDVLAKAPAHSVAHALALRVPARRSRAGLRRSGHGARVRRVPPAPRWRPRRY